MTIAGRVLRRMTLRLVGGLARRSRFIAVLTVLIGGALAASSLGVAPGLPSWLPGLDRSGYQATSNGEPTTTANYLRGQQSYDARLMWDAYSERSQAELQRRGRSPEADQLQLDQAKRIGTRIDQVHYIGAYPIPNGSMHFYVIAQTGRTRGDVSYLPYTFTLDSHGKIDGVQ